MASWTCRTCSTANWQNLTSCRWCGITPWPALSGSRAPRKGKTTTVTPTAGRTARAGHTPAAAAAEPPGVAAAPMAQMPEQGAVAQPQRLKAQLQAAMTARTCLAEAGATQSFLQELDEEITTLKRAMQDRRPVGERLEGLRGVITRSERRLEASKKELEAAQASTAQQEQELAAHQQELAQLESEIVQEFKASTPFSCEARSASVPSWIQQSMADVARHQHSGKEIDPASLADAIEAMLVPPPAPVPPEQWEGTPQADTEGDHMEEEVEKENTDPSYSVVRPRRASRKTRGDPAPRAPGVDTAGAAAERRGVRVNGPHAQDDGGFDLAVATANILSAAPADQKGTGAGANITGRMAELDGLFMKAGVHVVGVQEGRLSSPQTLSTENFTVHAAAAVKGNHGVQLWIAKKVERRLRVEVHVLGANLIVAHGRFRHEEGTTPLAIVVAHAPHAKAVRRGRRRHPHVLRRPRRSTHRAPRQGPRHHAGRHERHPGRRPLRPRPSGRCRCRAAEPTRRQANGVHHYP